MIWVQIGSLSMMPSIVLCNSRNHKVRKERHKILMDRNAGDGADSAEDSGSSQPYPSTFLGIPKGSARQLFQHFQGPMEDDTLKSHFECVRTTSSSLDSGIVASVFQLARELLLGRTQIWILLSFDLCDPTTSSSYLAFKGSHISGLPISNQGPTPPVHPTSGANSICNKDLLLPLSMKIVCHHHLLHSIYTSSRDAQRYGVFATRSVGIE
ncbi:hypothetical protein IFM89_036084 [Coptis chinensis]|uniref:Uncharacterized protein n=1 Tax=Coptis chinensis TaxID=261450 RepID=A0A835HZW9_9MAGN|nr:hypothetical protein IFM89_036084 [Coptis chinensis]